MTYLRPISGFLGIVRKALWAGAAWLLAAMLAAGPSWAADVAGASDYPGIGRFEGSTISGYDAKDFDEAVIPVGPASKGKLGEKKVVQGKVTMISYHTPSGASELEILSNYTNQLTAQGFEIVYQCETKDCGGSAMAYNVKTLPIPKFSLDPFRFRYAAAHKHTEGSDIWADIIVSGAADKTYTQVTVVEAGNLENKMVDAAQMASAIETEGSIALYGIYFDHDSAKVKSESDPTLAEIAKLLKDHAAMNVIVVGHTDNQGSLDYNLDLSKRRASAVKQALVGDYGISAQRLDAEGVGFLAPKATNETEEGRGKNRRVELISR